MGYNLKLPHYFYNYGGFNLGYVKGLEVPSNFYKEANLGLGKIAYTRPENNLLNLVMGEYTLYYAGYNDNRLGFGGASLNSSPLGSDGISPIPSSGNPGVGGYFSPEYIIANKFSLHMRGRINPLRSRYYMCGYLGTQNIAERNTEMIWGGSVGLRFNEEGRLGLGLLYQIDSFDVARRQDFIVNLIMKL